MPGIKCRKYQESMENGVQVNVDQTCTSLRIFAASLTRDVLGQGSCFINLDYISIVYLQCAKDSKHVQKTLLA